VGSNLAAVTREKQLAILIVIRRRLTAQGNGQATLDHEGTQRYLKLSRLFFITPMR